MTSTEQQPLNRETITAIAQAFRALGIAGGISKQSQMNGSPSTALPIPFDMDQAENILNQVLRRGTCEEINRVFHALGTVGYTATPGGDGHLWRLKAIE